MSDTEKIKDDNILKWICISSSQTPNFSMHYVQKGLSLLLCPSLLQTQNLVAASFPYLLFHLLMGAYLHVA